MVFTFGVGDVLLVNSVFSPQRADNIFYRTGPTRGIFIMKLLLRNAVLSKKR